MALLILFVKNQRKPIKDRQLKHLIRKCSLCETYTLKQQCPKCNAATIYPHPGRYSPEDKYIGYRVADRYKKSDRDSAHSN
jgi:H/ACA ribonucleoprotein complex subunit 3